jgi:tight adherence protein C
VSDRAGAAVAWACALTFGSAFVLLVMSVRSQVDTKLRRSISALCGIEPKAGRPDRMGVLFDAMGGTRVGRWVSSRIAGDTRILRRLYLAGRPWTVRSTAGRMVSAATAGGMTACVLVWFVPVAIVLIPIAVMVGGMVPGMTLARRARSRQARIEGQVPELVEMLVAATESGLPPAAAFIRSAEALSAPLADELSIAAERITLGAPWREALDATVDGAEAPSLARLARSLKRAHRLGASVRGSLLALVDELRREQRARAEERARRAPVQMLFPLVFLILPAFVLLTVGPVLLSTVRSLH